MTELCGLGRRFRVDFPVPAPLCGPGPESWPRVEVRAAQAPSPLPGPDGWFYESPLLHPSGLPALRACRVEGEEWLLSPEGVAFGIGASGFRWTAGREAELEWLWLRFCGTAAPYLLEREGLRVIHASVVAREGRAAALVGAEGAGKSTLALCLAQRGWDLLSDDLLAVVPDSGTVLPGWSALRLDPANEAASFPGEESVPLPGGLPKRLAALPRPPWTAGPVRLAAVFLLDRSATAARARLGVLRPAETTAALIAQSPLARLVEAGGDGPARLRDLARLAGETPSFQLIFPGGQPGVDQVDRLILTTLHP